MKTLLITLLLLIPNKIMADYKELKPIVLKWEGGYAGNIDGKTCTMKGVTLDTYRKYFGRQKTCKELRGIREDEWDYIFKSFWDKWLADSINSQSIANLVVDWYWASGQWGIRLPQRVLGVKDDGVVGKKTLAAINNYPNQKELFDKLWKRREQHFKDLAKTKGRQKFLRGWLARLSDFTYID